MSSLLRGRYRARPATSDDDLRAAQALRWSAFRSGTSDPTGYAKDEDRFDAVCQHILIEDIQLGDLVGCFRFLPVTATEIAGCYAAQFYDLGELSGFQGRMVEMGRFCSAPGQTSPDIIRTAWGAMTRYVERMGIDLLFGCSSFRGTDPVMYREAFALLRDRHLAPTQWQPRVRAPAVIRFSDHLIPHRADPVRGALALPPLLRTYLMLGGWVSDHAVIDADLGTLHVFTGLEIGKVPTSRARFMRALAV